MRTAALIALVVALAAPIGCREANAPEPSYCRKIGTPDELPRLYEDHGLSLVVLGDTVWLCPCGKARRLAGATEQRMLAGAGEERRVAGDVESRRRSGDDEDRRLAGDTESRQDRGDTEGRRLAGDMEKRDQSGDAESRNLDGDTEGRDLGGAAEERRLAGHTEVPSCAVVSTCSGFVVYTSSPRVDFFDGLATRSADDHCVSN